MNITLNESNCEVYVFRGEQNKQNSKSKQINRKNKMFCQIRKCFRRITGRLFKDENFVKNELMAYHPGFNFESVWDYKRRENDFIACYCSADDKRCEIVGFYNGFDGLAEVRYTHNNLWHFQNNIGSFLSAQMQIRHLPYEFTINKLVNDKRLIRL